MKKEKLTVNTLALGNLKQRRKQYTILIIGIILAMVLSSGILFFLFSSYETFNKMHSDTYGNQSAIVSTPNGVSIFDRAVSNQLLTDYGLAHIIGFGYGAEADEDMGTAIAWLDDKAISISGFSLIEGTYPEKENEIVIEKTALKQLGSEAEIGDEITIFVKPQNGGDYLDAITKKYTLVGIASDKRRNFAYTEDYSTVPAAFVAQNTQTEAGGKELISAYIVYNAGIDNSIMTMQSSILSFFGDTFNPANSGNHVVLTTQSNKSTYIRVFEGASDMGIYMVAIAVILVFASCIAIVDSFNSNLKERKKQIGMFRAVGATKRQIFKIICREAFIITLICTPVSIALAYGLVRLIMPLINEKAVMTKSLMVLPISAIVCIAVAMIAAVIPIFLSTRITPMQAIRNIDITRKMSVKKINSKKDFNVASHLAKRNSALYKSSKAAIGVILTATILFSCIGFSQVYNLRSDVGDYNYDYYFHNLNTSTDFDEGMFSDSYYNQDMDGMSEADKRDIESIPYFSKVVAVKALHTVFEADEIEDYHLCFQTLRKAFETNSKFVTYENYAEEMIDLENDSYLSSKELFSNGKDILCANMFSYDNYLLKSLEKNLTAGEINYDKLDSGEEIILIAPQTVKLAIYIDDTDDLSDYSVCDNEEIPSGYHVVIEGENPYKVGDKLNISVLEYMGGGDDELKNYSRVDKEVTVGAIISPMNIDGDVIEYNSFSFLTTHNGINNFNRNVKYSYLTATVDPNIKYDDALNETILSSLEPYEIRYDSWIKSVYSDNRDYQNGINSLLLTMFCVIVLGFSVCAGIVNNSVTSGIRERKKEIGTLRAVGADASVLVSSYMRQLVSMFATGLAAGFGGYALIFLTVKVLRMMNDKMEFDLNFIPWETIGFCAILFAICSLNLWINVKKEMKNSIVDNIREL
ncbi:MAG: ABC transporter permease [Eubacterium sp.]|nr:ABC transporter permease [Eubacterium sp.]